MAEDPKMARPQWENKFNLNTVLLLGGILMTGIGWGVTWQTQRSGQERNSEHITDLRTAVSALQAADQTYANLTYRVTRLEAASTAATQAQREQEKATAQLASDVRVIREIVERLDTRSKRP